MFRQRVANVTFEADRAQEVYGIDSQLGVGKKIYGGCPMYIVRKGICGELERLWWE